MTDIVLFRQRSRVNLYELAKATSIDFWNQPGDRFPRCALCGQVCYSPPEAHHFIIPRSYGVTVNKWWNLVPLHAACHRRAHAGRRDELIMLFLARLSD